MKGSNHTYRLRNVKTNLEVKSLFNAMRLKPYYDPEDWPTNPPEQPTDKVDKLDSEELNKPRRQTGDKTDNEESKQGTKQNDNHGANRYQNKNKDAAPEGSIETGSSNQEKKVSEGTNSKVTTDNEPVRPRDGSKFRQK